MKVRTNSYTNQQIEIRTYNIQTTVNAVTDTNAKHAQTYLQIADPSQMINTYATTVRKYAHN
jgi:hypothetical protein